MGSVTTENSFIRLTPERWSGSVISAAVSPRSENMQERHLKFTIRELTLPVWTEWIIARGCERKAATTFIADAKLQKLI